MALFNLYLVCMYFALLTVVSCGLSGHTEVCFYFMEMGNEFGFWQMRNQKWQSCKFFVFIYFFVSYFLLICIVFTVNQMLTTMINGERLCVLNYCELHCILDPYHRARSGQKLRMEDKKTFKIPEINKLICR